MSTTCSISTSYENKKQAINTTTIFKSHDDVNIDIKKIRDLGSIGIRIHKALQPLCIGNKDKTPRDKMGWMLRVFQSR